MTNANGKMGIGQVQAVFKQKMERILQCNACQTNLFHLVKVGKKQMIECSGCGVKKELNA